MRLASFLLPLGRREGGLSQASHTPSSVHTTPPPFLALWGGDTAGAQAGDPWPAEHPAKLRLASQDSVHRFLRLPALLGFLKPPRPMPPKMWYTPLEGYKRDF